VSTAPASHVESREPRLTVRTSPGVSNDALLGGTCAVLFLAPLCFGAVQWWAIFGLEASATLLFTLWAVRKALGEELNIVPNPLYAPMLAFVGLVALQYVWGVTSYRYATYSHLLLYVAYGMLAFIATQSLRRSSQLRNLSWAVCAYGGIVALFALLQGLSPNGKLYWIWALEQNGLIYGPYVNHNHYAGLMELLTPFPLVLANSRFPHQNQKFALVGVGSLMAGTIFLSGSRGGMLAFAVQLIAFALLLSGRPEKNWKQPGLLIAVMAAMIALLFWIGGGELTRRLVSIHTETHQELSGGTRVSIDRDSLRMWTKRPLLGWGFETFPEVYPQFRSFYTSFFVNQAHNDYLQLLVETGLAGFAIALWFLVLMARRTASKLKNWTETPNGVLTAGCLLGVLGIMVHSFLDFNLQIPANAALFYVLCALAAAEPVQESLRRRVRRRSSSVLEIGPPVTGSQGAQTDGSHSSSSLR
jgi:O-antigen ligase